MSDERDSGDQDELPPGCSPGGRGFESRRSPLEPPSTVAEQVATRLLGDEAELYLAFNHQLVRTVQRRVDAARETVDDACAFAWVQFMRWQPDRDRNWRAWLITTAEREAWRLRREEVRTIGFDVQDSEELEWEPPDPRDPVEERASLRHALDLLSAVPERRRQAKALHVMGYSYDEIRGVLGISLTRVNQLIAEANATMRREQFRIGAEQQPRSPRAARLRELEERPPDWLRASIGRPPAKTQRAEAVLAWRRAALAIDDYRRQYAPGVEHDPLRDRPADPRAGRAYQLACRAAERARDAREPHRDRSLER